LEESDTKLIPPFVHEVQSPWAWSRFYRKVAQPLPAADLGLPDNASTSPKSLDSTPDAESGSCSYDIDVALASLRRDHAWEVQSFVIAHEKACLVKVTQEISLEHQVESLEKGVAAWIAEHGGSCDSEAKTHLEREAKVFVEMVHREEMLKAESKLKETHEPSGLICVLLRVACVVSVMLAVAFMSHEMLTRLFAILFALGCGMALLWEDLVRSCLQLLLGGTSNRLSELCGQGLRLLALVRSATR